MHDHFISNFQSGFRREHSTIINCASDCALWISKDAAFDSVFVLLDFPKAFDTVDDIHTYTSFYLNISYDLYRLVSSYLIDPEWFRIETLTTLTFH